MRARIPDPNAASTFESSRVDIGAASAPDGATWMAWFAALLTVRRTRLVPRLSAWRSAGAEVLGAGAVRAAWHDAAGRIDVVLNLGTDTLSIEPPCDEAGAGHYRSDGQDDSDRLPPDTFLLRWRNAQ